MRRLRILVLVGAALTSAGCMRGDVFVLAGDGFAGRDNGTPGSSAAQAHLIDRLDDFATGLAPGSGADRFRQPISGGTNIVGLVPGGDLADEYVVLGAHYDHVTDCDTSDPSDTICNGATDNAAGVAEVLAIAEAVATSPEPRRRSLVVAFWDREEDGMRGSRHYVENPLVPLSDTVAYLNFDIQGANLLPSLRNVTFAVGAESGGQALRTLLDDAATASTLDLQRLSALFGQGRSDYVNFLNRDVPTVFFTDSTGPCYHTAQDEYDVVDFDKLSEQTNLAAALTEALLDHPSRPVFDPDAPPVTYDDAVVLDHLAGVASADLDRFTPSQQATFQTIVASLADIVSDGPEDFDSDDISTVLGHAMTMVGFLASGECDGFLASG